MEEAIEKGLMTVYVLEKKSRKGAKRTGPVEEITPLVISSVYDPKTKRHIPLEDAIQKGTCTTLLFMLLAIKPFTITEVCVTTY